MSNLLNREFQIKLTGSEIATLTACLEVAADGQPILTKLLVAIRDSVVGQLNRQLRLGERGL